MKPSKEEITERVCRIVKQIVEDWGMEVSAGRDTQLIAELGFSSLDVIDLLASLETQMGRQFPYEELVVLEGGGYRQELTIEDLVVFLHENYDRSRPAHGSV